MAEVLTQAAPGAKTQEQSGSFKDGYAGSSWLKRQWPWWTAGLMTGIAEVINFLFLPLGHAKHKFVGVPSGMARMLAGAESTVFGGSLIATKADYQPSIQWVIIGALISALVFAWLEGEYRGWVKYPKAMLISTAFGAFFFAWGTRVAGGCTLHHLLGGFAAMNVKSWVVMFFATIGALAGFAILRQLNLSQYFKSQDTKWYVSQAQKMGWADGLTFDPKESGTKSWLFKGLLAFMIILGVLFAYNALFGNDFAVQAGFASSFEKTKLFKAMLTMKNLPNIALLLVVGVLLGASVAKTGFGTECGLINPELGNIAERGERKGANFLRMPFSIRTVFVSYQPFAALSLHIAIIGTVIFLAFAFFGIMEGHHWATKAFAEQFAANTGLHFHNTGVSIRTMTSLSMDIFGGLLLGLGTFLMIGCEFRNYGRTGLLYITGILIWPFFYVGYLPYTLNRGFWDGLMGSSPYTSTTFFPAMVAPSSHTIQVLIYALYILFWIAAFIWAVKRGAKNVGVKPMELLSMNSESMALARLEKIKADGNFEELDAVEKELFETAQKAY